MNKAHRIKMVKEVVDVLSAYEWDELDFVLRQFDCPTTDPWQGTKRAYCFEMLAQIKDGELSELHGYLNGEGNSSPAADVSPWKEGYLRLFASHLVKEKVLTASVRESLLVYGIDTFVAHDSIEPTKEWMAVIEAALLSCDAGVAFLHESFIESSWCDQEVGYMLARRVPILPLMFGNHPYGFLGKYQGIHCQTKEGLLSAEVIASKILDWLSTHPATQSAFTEALVSAFETSKNFAQTCAIWPWLSARTNLSAAHLRRLEAAVVKNSQVSMPHYGSRKVADLVRELVASKTDTQEIPF